MCIESQQLLCCLGNLRLTSPGPFCLSRLSLPVTCQVGLTLPGFRHVVYRLLSSPLFVRCSRTDPAAQGQWLWQWVGQPASLGTQVQWYFTRLAGVTSVAPKGTNWFPHLPPAPHPTPKIAILNSQILFLGFHSAFLNALFFFFFLLLFFLRPCDP